MLQTAAEAFEAGPDAASLLQQQLRYYQAWTCGVALAPVQAVPLSTVLSAVRVVVGSLPEGTTAQELQAYFNELMAAHSAAAAPGRAVTCCELQEGGAVLQLRCAAEASNCLAFDGAPFKGAVLKVARPSGYIPEAAILLGPLEPSPMVRAAVASANAGCTDACRPLGAAAAAGSGGASFASAARAGAAQGACGGPHSARAQQAAGAAAPPAGGFGGGAGVHKPGSRDLLLPASDQCKQDEVFIGGLPSHWKAQQLKELLAPYGQLKSLSVAMDASTGKNKGYAFVVFACSDMVPTAIEELDCRVVEGKILAVQRATEGKVSYARESSSTGGSDIGGLRDGGAGPVAGAAPGGAVPGLAPQQQHHHHGHLGPLQPLASPQQLQPLPHHGPLHPRQQQQQQQQQQHHHHRSSSTGSGLGLPPHIPVSDLAAAAAGALGGSGHGHTRSHSGGGHGLSGLAAFAAGAGSAGPPPPLGLADGGVGGPRPPAGPPPPASGGGLLGHHSGPSSTKQYDVNELYIGDLPLTWDEDAVRRLLGRFGRIKYFTLRNGRDKNFAFCKFKDSSVVDAAISGLHGKIVDGYFLNVRRAVEGKQQAAAAAAAAAAQQNHHQQQQQPWMGGKQPQAPQGLLQQQPQGPRASFDAGSTGSRLGPPGPASHHMRSASSDQHPQLSRSLPGAGAPGVLYHGTHSGVAAAGRAGGTAAQMASPRVGGAAAAAAAAAAAVAAPAGDAELHQGKRQQLQDQAQQGAAGTQQQQQQESSASAGSAPSTPGTPTVPQEQQPPSTEAAGQQQQQQPNTAPGHALPSSQAAAAAAALGPYGSFLGPQLLQRTTQGMPAAAAGPYLQQQQQQLVQQQQQQQQAAFGPGAGLFNGPLPSSGCAPLFGPNGPASWPGGASLQGAAPPTGSAAAGAASAASAAAGGPLAPTACGGLGGSLGLGAALAGKQPEGQAPAAVATPGRQSLLQTWDMLSPWSLFSHPAQ